MYPPGPLDGYYPRFQGDWRQGLSLWTQDYPKADRMLAAATRRLTRVDARSVEQAVSLDDGDEIYNWPWLYAVQVGEWGPTDQECAKLRDYLLRGGFFMADDFHGHAEQAYFESTMKKVFPERPIVDIPDSDPIFHTVFDLDERYRVTGAEHLRTGYKADGKVARWEGIYDDKHRIMVAISLNSDLGDSWEWSDTPQLSSQILRSRPAHRRQLHRLRHDPLRKVSLGLVALTEVPALSNYRSNLTFFQSPAGRAPCCHSAAQRRNPLPGWLYLIKNSS